jgi:hypothetical protein
MMDQPEHGRKRSWANVHLREQLHEPAAELVFAVRRELVEGTFGTSTLARGSSRSIRPVAWSRWTAW